MSSILSHLDDTNVFNAVDILETKLIVPSMEWELEFVQALSIQSSQCVRL